MNSDNLIKMEKGGVTYTKTYQCKDRQPTDKMVKYLIICMIIIFVWLACISGFCIYIYHRVEDQNNARPCTCLQAGEDVEAKSEGISQSLQEDNRNTPQDHHVSRDKRNVISNDGQLQLREKGEIKTDDPEEKRDQTACRCLSKEQQEDMVIKLLAEWGVGTEVKVRHRRSKVSNDRQGSRGKRRKKPKKPKPKRTRRTTTGTTPLEPSTTEQSATNTTIGNTNANTQPAQLAPACAPVPVPVPTHAPRLPLFHMTGKEVDSMDPIRTLNSTECPECRVIEHGFLDENNRFKPRHNMYKSWDVDQTISDHSIAQMNDGVVTIKKTGIYLVYSQIVFYNSIVYNGVALKLNGEEKSRCFQHGPAPANVNAPTDGSRTPFNNAVFSTCNPLQPMYLRQYDNLTFVSLQNDSWTHFNPLTSYWGLIMLSDTLPVNPTTTPPVPTQ